MSRRFRPGVLIAGGFTLSLAGLALCGPATAQLKPGSQQGLGLTGASIPPILQQVRADPYRMPAAPICASIDEEMAKLDAVMGPEVDKLKTDRSVADRAAGYVRGMIPYHGVVRFLTGADGKDRELQAAASAGYARRGFLHGLKAQSHCGEAQARVAAADAPAPTVEGVDASAQVADAKAPGAAPPLKTLVSAGAPPAAPDVPAPQPRTHVVYRLIDVTSGRAIIPDDSGAAEPAGPGGAR